MAQKGLNFVTIGGDWTLIPYFCGNEDFCLKPSKESVDAAMANVRKNYLLVGILEDYERFLKLAEILLPIFFKGSVTIYESEYSKLRKQSKSYLDYYLCM